MLTLHEELGAMARSHYGLSCKCEEMQALLEGYRALHCSVECRDPPNLRSYDFYLRF